MRLFLYFYLITLHFSSLNAQDRHDFTWILGARSATPTNPDYGGTSISFKNGTFEADTFDISFRMLSHSMMCDADGNLQYYTNNCRIENKLHQTMDNGDNISPGFIHDSGCNGISQTYSIYEGLMSLPFPGHPNQHVMFHDRQDFYYKIIDVMYSIIDMNANNGLGKVIQKNQILMQDTLAWTLSAVKHANGRDWWVVAPELSKNSFYFFLLDPQGVHGPYKQIMTQPWFPEQNANFRSLFSPDGRQFVRLTHGEPAKFWVYDFDRCTGTLSNQRILSLPDELGIYNPCGAFSADSRYLYVTAFVTELHQFDMQADDIQASHQKIGEYDGFLDQFGRSTSMYSMALAPDGRIYMGGQSNTWNLHTIHRPERGGLNCDFRQHDVPLIKSVYENMPNLPNFRLYNEVGSSCDTLGVVAPMSAYWRYEQDTLAGPLEMDFTDMSYYQPVSWFWDFGDGSVGSTAHEPEHIFPAPGIYTVCLTACNALGVCDTLCRDIEILTVGSTNPITSASKLLSVYPNPASDKLWISHGDLGKEARFELYNATGLLVKKQALTQLSESEVVSIVNLPSGFYFWKLHTKEGKVESGKILVGR